MSKRSIFTVGGTVQAGGGKYLRRKMDDELLTLCRAGTFSFVLTARQMGKSSLMVQTARRLAEEGRRSVIIDLSQIGVQIRPEAWYLGLLISIEDSLSLDTDVYSWWQDYDHLGFAQRLTQFFQDVLLAEVTVPVVIFVDEIDSTLSLPFTDDFFAAIRYIYNARSSVPAFERLSFVLIGVATPDDLISDPKRTPFNIGRRVDLNFFEEEEAMPLAEGFDLSLEEARQVIRWILFWTGGHPYLTQRLCREIVDQHPQEVTKDYIDRAVAAAFFSEKCFQDSNLRFVRDMLTRRAPDPRAVLSVFDTILRGRHVTDENQSAAITHLKLSGIIGEKSGRLGIANPIYAEVFDRAWVKEQFPEHWIKRVPPAVIGLVIALFAVVISLATILYQSEVNRQASESARQAQENNTRLDSLNSQLNTQYLRAESLGRDAIVEKIIADSLRSAEAEVNEQLMEQAQISTTLLQQLSVEILLSDSLRRATEAANTQLTIQNHLKDSLRTIAEATLGEAYEARLETITIALASKAVRQVRLGDVALGGLLARQAYLFSRRGDGEFMDPLYDALVQSLNAIVGTGSSLSGGPEVLGEFEGGVRSVAYSPDGRWIAAAIDDGTVALWRTVDQVDRPVTVYIDGHTAGVRCLAFSPDGRLLATGSDDHTVIVWKNLEQERPERLLTGQHQGGVWVTTFTPDGTRLAIAGMDTNIMIWNLETGVCQDTLKAPAGARIRSLTFSPDGEVLVSGGDDGLLRLWRWKASGSRPVDWETRQGRLHAVAFNSDGDLLVTGGDSTTVRIWFMTQPYDRPDNYRMLRGHEGPVNSLVFSPDGRHLATGSSDHSVQLWDIDRLDIDPIILHGHTSWVWSLAFSPDGEGIVTGGADRTVLLWNIKPELLAEQVCDGVNGRELTRDEWDQFIGGDFPFSVYYEPCEQLANSN